jgi:hypothetical protein
MNNASADNHSRTPPLLHESPAAPQPGPAQGPQAAAEPAAELPLALRPGGVVDRIRGRVSAAGFGQDGGVARLREKIRQDLDAFDLRFRLARVNHIVAGDLTSEERYKVVLIETEAGSTDPVLLYTLACHAQGGEVSSSRRDRAWQPYLQQPDAYDAVLGDDLPADFRNEARDHLTQQNYERGASPTAVGDWATYQSRLRTRQQLPGISTGLPGLDGALGGLRGLTFLGGGTGLGKTTLALAMAGAALRASPDLGVLFYSLDMPKDALYGRLLCAEAGITYADLTDPDPSEETRRRLHEAGERLGRDVLPRLRIVERRQVRQEGGFTAEDLLRHRGSLLQEAHDARRALVVVDYFGYMDVPAKKGSPLEEDHRRIDVLKDALAYTRTADSPLGDSFLVIAEVRKPGEAGRTGLTLDDLLGSCRLGYAPDAILLLEAEGPAVGEEVPLVLQVAKGRDGTARGRISLTFEYLRYRFRERSGAPAKGKAVVAGKAPGGNTPVNPLARGRKGRKE